jgi:hypothetical protein
MIKSRQDENVCLTHHGAENDVSAEGCDINNQSQRWNIEQVSKTSGEVTVNLKPQDDAGLCLDMHPSEKVQGNGYRVYLHGCHGGDNQHFVHRDGKLMQRFTLNNYCVDWWFTNGNTVHMPTCHDSANLGTASEGPNQLWDFYFP